MDLDNIKRAWQEADVKSTIAEEKIQRMLDSRGKNAFDNLMAFEKWGLIVGILCLPCSFLFKEKYLIVFYIISVIYMLVWQTYKYKFLKKIDISEMGILDISIAITKYRKYIFREFIVAIIWAIVFSGLWMYLKIYKDLAGDSPEKLDIIPILAILSIVGLLIIIVVAYTLYRLLYMKNIKQIEKSISEIEDFGQDNM